MRRGMHVVLGTGYPITSMINRLNILSLMSLLDRFDHFSAAVVGASRELA
jgi:hypothetical protein